MVVPYLFGFVPQHSIVVVGTRDRQIKIQARVDIPPDRVVTKVARSTLDPVSRRRPDGVTLLAFESHPGQSRRAIAGFAAIAKRFALTVEGIAIVRDGRWWDVGDPDWPDEGVPLPSREEIGAVAELVGLGLAPHPSREALAASVSSPSAHDTAGPDFAEAIGAERDTIVSARAAGPRELRAAWAQQLTAWVRLLDPDRRGESGIGGQDLVLLAASLHDIPFRDGLISWVSGDEIGFVDYDPVLVPLLKRTLKEFAAHRAPSVDPHESLRRWARVTDRLATLCAAVPDPWAGPALTVLAHHCWWHGDGALARVALDRALQSTPDYVLAQLLSQVLDHGIAPPRLVA